MVKAADDFVVMGVSICPVCVRDHKPGTLLLHRQLKSIPEDKRRIPPELCEYCRKKVDDGFVGLIGIDPEKSDLSSISGGVARLASSQAHRTGHTLWVRRPVLEQLLSRSLSEDYFLFPQENLDWIVAQVTEQGVEVPVEDLDVRG